MYSNYGGGIARIEKECNNVLSNNPEMNNYDYKERLKKEIELIEESGNKLANEILYARYIVTELRREKLKTIPLGGLGNTLVAYLLGITRYDPIQMNFYPEFFFGPGKNNKDIAAPIEPKVCVAWDQKRSMTKIDYRDRVRNMTDDKGNLYEEIEGVRFYDSATITRLHNLEERSEQYIEKSINKDYNTKRFTYEKYLEFIAGNALNDKDIFLKKMISVSNISIVDAYAIIEKIAKKKYQQLTKRQLDLIVHSNLPFEIIDQLRNAGKCYAGSENFGLIELEWIRQSHSSVFRDAQVSKTDHYEMGKIIKNYTGHESVVVIPEGVTHIGNYAFFDNMYLKKIVFPSTLEVIGREAFCDCTNLEEVVFNEGLETIEDMAFGDCTSLESVVLPSSIEWIGDEAFSGCSNLKEVIIPKDRIDNTYISRIGMSAFGSCKKLKNVKIEKPVEDWGRSIFARSGIEEFVFPDSPSYKYQYLPDRMFFMCRNLKRIASPVRLERIGENAFQCCEALEEIDVPC